MRPAAVIDTNVLGVANNRLGEWDNSAENKCTKFLDEIRSGVVVLDDSGLIVDEYCSVARAGGNTQPRAADGFLRWLLQNQWNPDRCERVNLTFCEKPKRFEEFPDDSELSGFHSHDRKFVATARASTLNPFIAVASDRGWSDHGRALQRNGITVKFLCPELRGSPRRKRSR